MSKFAYKAFVTYSHADSKAAAWLQRALESYRVPSRLVGKKTRQGKITRRIGAVFRDRDELSAGGDLGQSLNSALSKSEYLIVICSPAARKSRWVNLEISEFRRTHPESKILCLIVAGEPFLNDASNQELQECFPEALGYLEGDKLDKPASEPVAADIREGGDGKRLARLKIVSGLLGVGLDQLIQRDAQRRQRNLLIATMASATGMLAMAMLSFVAIDARNNEELRRAEAEDLIEFMLGDLRDQLDSVGRLDVLDAVGEKAIEYYSNVDLAAHSESSLGRRARAFHLLGEVDNLQGDMEGARIAFAEAYQTTEELLVRLPSEGERVYNHAQSVFWLGFFDWRLGNFARAEPAFREYLSLAIRLTELDPGNADWLVELGSANLNLGAYVLEVQSPREAIPYFEESLLIFEKLYAENFENTDLLWPVAQTNAYLADASVSVGSLEAALDYRSAELGMYQLMQADDSANQDVNLSLLSSHQARAIISLQLGAVADAVGDLVLARSYGDDLLDLDPENTFVAHEASGAYLRLSEALGYAGDAEEAAMLLQQADEMVSRLLEKEPNVLTSNTLRYKVRLQQSQQLASVTDNQDATERINLLGNLRDELQVLASDAADVPEVQTLLAEVYFNLGKAYAAQGSDLQSAQHMRLAIEVLSSIKTVLPPQIMAMLSEAYGSIGSDELAVQLALELELMGFSHPGYVIY